MRVKLRSGVAAEMGMTWNVEPGLRSIPRGPRLNDGDSAQSVRQARTSQPMTTNITSHWAMLIHK